MNSAPPFFRNGLRSLAMALIALAGSLPGVARAQSAVMTDGGEFEFVDPSVEIVPGRGLKGHEIAMAKRFNEVLKAKCVFPECRRTVAMGKWAYENRYTFAEGFTIQVSWDPNVVEILIDPDTRLNRHRMKDRIQEVIFGTAAEAGLTVDPNRRAGHYNAGVISTFGDDGARFLRFFIDFNNRPELALGILRDPNLLNAPPLAALGADQREALSRLSEDVRAAVDQGLTPGVAEVARRIIQNVFTRTSFADRYPDRNPVHYQAFGLKKLVFASKISDQPFELRSVRSQASFDEFLLLGDLIEARVAYTNSLPPDFAFRVTGTSRTDFTAQQLVDRFYVYVSECGLDWERFRELLPARLRPMTVTPGVKDGRISSATDLAALRDLADLAPASPWVNERFNAALASPDLDPEAKKSLRAALAGRGSAGWSCSKIF